MLRLRGLVAGNKLFTSPGTGELQLGLCRCVRHVALKVLHHCSPVPPCPGEDSSACCLRCYRLEQGTSIRTGDFTSFFKKSCILRFKLFCLLGTACPQDKHKVKRSINNIEFVPYNLETIEFPLFFLQWPNWSQPAERSPDTWYSTRFFVIQHHKTRVFLN